MSPVPLAHCSGMSSLCQWAFQRRLDMEVDRRSRTDPIPQPCQWLLRNRSTLLKKIFVFPYGKSESIEATLKLLNALALAVARLPLVQICGFRQSRKLWQGSGVVSS